MNANRPNQIQRKSLLSYTDNHKNSRSPVIRMNYINRLDAKLQSSFQNENSFSQLSKKQVNNTQLGSSEEVSSRRAQAMLIEQLKQIDSNSNTQHHNITFKNQKMKEIHNKNFI